MYKSTVNLLEPVSNIESNFSLPHRLIIVKCHFFKTGHKILPKATYSFPSLLGRNVPNFSQKYGCSLQRNRLLKLAWWQPTWENHKYWGMIYSFHILQKELHRNPRHSIMACASLWQKTIQKLVLPDWCDCLLKSPTNIWGVPWFITMDHGLGKYGDVLPLISLLACIQCDCNWNCLCKTRK